MMRLLCFCWLCLFSSQVMADTLVASVEPLAKMLRELYDNTTEVTTLLSANQNPHTPALSPRQALRVQQADLVVWLGDAVEPSLATLIQRRASNDLALLTLADVHTRSRHDSEAHDAHETHHNHLSHIDPHLWLSLHNMAVLARAVAERHPQGLKDGQPDAFVAALAEHKAAMATRLGPLTRQPWLSYHNPWGYLADTLGLAQPLMVSRQMDSGPSNRHFVTLAKELQAQGVACAIREPEARANLMVRLCPDCRHTPLDPLGRDHPSLNYLQWLDRLAAGFQRCLATPAS